MPRSYSAYSWLLQVCVECLTRLEREEDLRVLALRFTALVGLGAPLAEAACRVGYIVSRASACMHAVVRVLTCPGEEDVLDRAREDPDDDEDALAARRPALFRPSSPWTSISIHRGQSPS